MRRTYAPNPNNLEQNWHFLDANGQILGKLATQIAQILTGKNKAIYTPNQNMGDKVVVTNAEKVVLTGNKLKNKVYNWYTGFPGGLKSETVEKTLKRKPTDVLRKAVKGMLAKNKLQDVRMANLYIYAGDSHKHQAQLPQSKEKTK